MQRFKLGSPEAFAISPDGMRIAIVPQGLHPGKLELLDLTTGKEKSIPLPANWKIWQLYWTPDGKGLYLSAQAKGYFMSHLALDGTFRVLLDRGRDNWLGFATPSRDGLQLAFIQQTFEDNAWLLENF